MYKIEGAMGEIGVEKRGNGIFFIRDNYPIYEFQLRGRGVNIDGVPEAVWWDIHLSKKTWFYPEIREKMREFMKDFYG